MKALHTLVAGLVLGAGAIWGFLIILVAVPIALAVCVLFLWLFIASPIFILAGVIGLMPFGMSRDLALFPAQSLAIGGMAVGVLWGAGLIVQAAADVGSRAWRRIGQRR